MNSPLICDVVAPSTTITLRGQTFHLPPATLADWSAVAQRLREQIHDPLPALMPRLAALPEELAVKLYESTATRYEAALQKISVDVAIAHALSSLSGLAYLIWLLLSRQPPAPL